MSNAPSSEARHEERGGLGTPTSPSKCPRGKISVIISNVVETPKMKEVYHIKVDI